MDEAIELVELGKGSLVTSFVSNNDKLSKDFVVNAAHMNGRILVLNSRCGKESTGHGSPLPLLTHGGPGRAGGGEEMGGVRGDSVIFTENSYSRSSSNNYKNY